jgi:hypothetical protein
MYVGAPAGFEVLHDELEKQLRPFTSLPVSALPLNCAILLKAHRFAGKRTLLSAVSTSLGVNLIEVRGLVGD